MNGDELLGGLAELVAMFEQLAASETAAAVAEEADQRTGPATVAYNRAGVWRSAGEHVSGLLIRARTDGWSLDWRSRPAESPQAAAAAPPATITPRNGTDDPDASLGDALAGAVGVIVDVLADIIRGRPRHGQ